MSRVQMEDVRVRKEVYIVFICLQCVISGDTQCRNDHVSSRIPKSESRDNERDIATGAMTILR